MKDKIVVNYQIGESADAKMTDKKTKAFIAINIGNNTIITRKFVDSQNSKVNIFGLTYTLDDIVNEGWKYEIHYYKEGEEPISVFRC